MTRKPQPKQSAKGPLILAWGQIVHVARVLGVISWDDSSKATAFTLRKRLLAEGHVRQIAKGRYEFVRRERRRT